MARVRRDGTQTEIRTARELDPPTIKWKRDGRAYLYRVRVIGENLDRFFVNKETIRCVKCIRSPGLAIRLSCLVPFRLRIRRRVGIL